MTGLIPFFIYALPIFCITFLLVMLVLVSPGFRQLYARRRLTSAIFQKYLGDPVSAIKWILLSVFRFLVLYILHVISLYLSVIYAAFIMKKTGLTKKIWPAAIIGCTLLALLPWGIYRIAAFFGHLSLATGDIAKLPEQLPLEIGVDASLLAKEERAILHARWQYLLVSGVFRAVHVVQKDQSAVVSVKNGGCIEPAAITAYNANEYRDSSSGIIVDYGMNLGDRRQMLNFRYEGKIPFEFLVSEQAFLQLYLDSKCLQVDADAPWKPSFRYVDTGTLAVGFKSWPFDMDGWLRRAEIQLWTETKKGWNTVFRTTKTALQMPDISLLNISSFNNELCPDLPDAEKTMKFWVDGILPETAGESVNYRYCPKKIFAFRMQKSGSLETPLLGSLKPVDIAEKRKGLLAEDIQQKVDNLLASKSWSSMTALDRAFVEAYLDRRRGQSSSSLTERESKTIRKIVADKGWLEGENNITKLLDRNNWLSQEEREDIVRSLVFSTTPEKQSYAENWLVENWLIWVSIRSDKDNRQFPLSVSEKKIIKQILLHRKDTLKKIHIWSILRKNEQLTRELLPDLVRMLPEDKEGSIAMILATFPDFELVLRYEDEIRHVLNNNPQIQYNPLLIIVGRSQKDPVSLFRARLELPYISEIHEERSEREKYDWDKLIKLRWTAYAVCEARPEWQDALMPDVLSFVEKFSVNGEKSRYQNTVTDVVATFVVMLRKREDQTNALRELTDIFPSSIREKVFRKLDSNKEKACWVQ